jgi:hypothetical protein
MVAYSSAVHRLGSTVITVMHPYQYRWLGALLCKTCEGRGWYWDETKAPCQRCRQTGWEPSVIYEVWC